MTKAFTDVIKLSDKSVESFELAQKYAKSPEKVKRDIARKQRRDRIAKMRNSA